VRPMQAFSSRGEAALSSSAALSLSGTFRMSDTGEDRERTADPHEGQPLGQARSTITREIVRLQAEYYGQGPTRAKTYITEDLVVVVLEETFTPAERTLVEHGDKGPIEEIRRRFQSRMAQQFRSVVEQATGREVKTFLSESNVDDDVAIEVFLLGGPRTDMAEFEDPKRDPPAPG
jgi:uncharacterized protein YbcI